MTDQPYACPDCLRRARLLALLAPYIERSAGQMAKGRYLTQLLRLDNDELAGAVAPDVASRLVGQIRDTSADELESEIAESSYWCCCRHDRRFPAALCSTPDAPWTLFGAGDPQHLGRLHDDRAVAIVGSKMATAYGRETARSLGYGLAGAGLSVISGLAFGIDGCAHRGALDGGETVAVMGCGVDVPYPAAHRSLWGRIVDRGLVISELPLGCAPWRWTFQARNRIVAALAGMTVVVEAAERSGSLLTADMAADLGREVGAVPGPVGSRASAGTNALLAGGACLIRDTQDVLDSMLGTGVRQPTSPPGPQLNGSQREALAALHDGAQSPREVAADTDLSESDAEVNLEALATLGYVEFHPRATYSLTGLRAPAQAD